MSKRPVNLLAAAREFAKLNPRKGHSCWVCLRPPEEREAIDTLRTKDGWTYPQLAAWAVTPKDHNGLGYTEAEVSSGRFKTHFQGGHAKKAEAAARG